VNASATAPCSEVLPTKMAKARPREIDREAGQVHVQPALARRPKRGPVIDQNRALCSAILFCARCGESPMYKIRSGGREITYYRCTGRGAQRKGCGNNILTETVDDLVCQIMIGLKRPIMKIVFIPGNDHSAQLADVQFQLKQLANEDLTDEQYDAELARLRAERDRIRELPIEPGRVERVDTGETYASRWASLQTDTERNDWLRSAGVKIWAWRNPDDAEAAGKAWADEIRQALSESVTAEALGKGVLEGSCFTGRQDGDVVVNVAIPS
jgi:hypothetical protein